MKIILSIDMPKPEAPVEKAPPLLDKVREYITRVQSPEMESKREWHYLQTLYKRLCKVKKLNPLQEQLVYWLEPLMSKHGYAHQDGGSMNRGKDHLNEGEK